MSKIETMQSRLRQKWTYAMQDTMGVMGFNEKIFEGARGARIIVYHGICPSNPTRFNSLFLTLKTFEQHLQFYKKHFHIVSLQDYYARRFSNDRFNVCLTFDDGFANNYKYVLPLIEAYGVPATFFATAIRDAGYDILWNDCIALAQKFGPQEFEFRKEIFIKNGHDAYVSMIDRRPLKEMLREETFTTKADAMMKLDPWLPAQVKHRVADYWMQMTTSQLQELSRSRFATIGCHGYYHNDLARHHSEDVKIELIRSKQFLENAIQREVEALAFPYGSYSRETVSVAKSLGFTRLLAAEFLFPEDQFDDAIRERFIVNPCISVNNQMLATVHGKYCS
jgi:peptidoglycan/xylan/chitin deacetylase (PgdA/CDA1 family)